MPATTESLGKLSRRLAAGDRLLSAWATLGHPGVAETLVRQGFDTAVLDMQHGTFTFESACTGIGTLALAGAPAIVRVPVGGFALASRLLDAGAAAVIAPMINSVEDARALAGFAKFPPLGERSWGPHRGLTLSGLAPTDYLAEANRLQLALAMIETRTALDALDDILAVPGIDGVFVGPADLSISLSNGRLDPGSQEVDEALSHVAARAKVAGKVAGLFCFDGPQAKRMGQRGFALCSIATDAMLLRATATAALEGAR